MPHDGFRHDPLPASVRVPAIVRVRAGPGLLQPREGGLMMLVALWRSIAEPRHLKIAFLGAYIITLYMGTVTMLFPPASIAGALGDSLTGWMAGFLIVSGLIGIVSVLPGWWASERLGIYSAFFGLLIYGGVALALQITEGGSRLTQLGAISLAIVLFVVRLLLIRKHDFEPKG